MPGYEQQGLPVPSLNYQSLTYHCNALSSFYATLVVGAALHWFNIFRLTEVINNFGSMMTAAMIWGWGTSFATYFITVAMGKQHRMSGNFFYDFWMGAPLNPRIGIVDLKMWAEVRIPWVLLFLIAVSGACNQYEEIGYVTPVGSNLSAIHSANPARTWPSWFSPLVCISTLGKFTRHSENTRLSPMAAARLRSASHKPGTCSTRRRSLFRRSVSYTHCIIDGALWSFSGTLLVCRPYLCRT